VNERGDARRDGPHREGQTMTTEVTTTKTSIRVLKEQDEWASTLLDLARTATDRLVLVSPWLGRAAVLTLLRESAHVPNRQLLVRWPTRDTEAAFVAPQLLRELHRGDHGQIELPGHPGAPRPGPRAPAPRTGEGSARARLQLGFVAHSLSF